MPYIDESYLNDTYGSDEVSALCPGGATQVANLIETATAEIEGALTAGGYSAAVPASTYAAVTDVPIQIKMAAFVAWIRWAHVTQSKPVPSALEPLLARIEESREGAIEITGVPKDLDRAPGGSQTTEDPSITTDDQVFTRAAMEGF